MLLWKVVLSNVSLQEGGEKVPTDESGKTLYSDVDYLETWPMMEELVKMGLTKSIGISNFNKDQIERVLSIATIVPATNQVCNLLQAVI